MISSWLGHHNRSKENELKNYEPEVTWSRWLSHGRWFPQGFSKHIMHDMWMPHQRSAKLQSHSWEWRQGLTLRSHLWGSDPKGAVVKKKNHRANPWTSHESTLLLLPEGVVPDFVHHWIKPRRSSNLLGWSLLLLFLIFIYLFRLGWVFVAAGFSLQCLLLLLSTGSKHMDFSSCSFQVLEHRFTGCGAQA